MSRFPEPPPVERLRSTLRTPDDVVALHRTTRLVRIFSIGGNHPQAWNEFRRFGPLPHGRFDPHPLSGEGVPAEHSIGVCYFGLTARTCVAEAFQATSVLDRTTRAPQLVIFRPARTLHLVDLSGVWPTRAGASQTISSGPKQRSQAWARAIQAAFPELDGVWYRSAMDGGAPAVSLWDGRASDALPEAPDVLLPLDHPGLDLPLGRLCEQLNYALFDGRTRQ